ncbi:2'-5' RNA ligase family protein [Allokutzneria sp. A3M-2-11 16]|uniref:2'-5' RNA ligase family protein n=1 Tax=Allokutzneria sp. A3M-2-11 16 TaxID=2962043 RepID=UPI0020B816FB|nr:2'-5' RNA ligase family protein [Allokutzneria sp. A3M-2-11 16]MCP3799949.1 2'-5' RNA ligase family protein [Allokutzneria sp. A3M-2-11 16]
MADVLRVFFDGEAEVAVRGLWRKLAKAGVPAPTDKRPQLTLAAATAIPQKTRDELRAELEMLAMPSLWLRTLGTFTSTESVLMLGAVVDGELLAVHSAVHDVLAGKVKNPSAYYLPGSWLPHCVLAQGCSDAEIVTGFTALHPVEPIRADVAEIGIVDTRTGAVDVLL